MRIVALALVACGGSTSAPQPSTWRLTFSVRPPTFAALDTTMLDSTGALTRNDRGVDLGHWTVPPDKLAAIAPLVLAPDLLDTEPSHADVGDASHVYLEVDTPAGTRTVDYGADRVAPRVPPLAGALDALVAAHDLENLAAAGPFTIDVDGRHVDSNGHAAPAALARIATLLLTPDLANLADAPGDHAFAITRGGVTRTLRATTPMPMVLGELYAAVESAQ